MTQGLSSLPTHDAAKALAHPLRVQILGLLDGREASPVEMARELELDIPLVGYHFKVLEKLGVIRQTRTRMRRGAVEHFYVTTVRITITQQTPGD